MFIGEGRLTLAPIKLVAYEGGAASFSCSPLTTELDSIMVTDVNHMEIKRRRITFTNVKLSSGLWKREFKLHDIVWTDNGQRIHCALKNNVSNAAYIIVYS